MKVFGQLERAQAENLGADPTAGVKGRLLFNTVSGALKVDDGSAIQSLIYSGTAAIVNADISASAAIARSKLASGSNDHVVINSGAGVLSSEATLAKVRGGAGADMSSVTFPTTGTIATIAGVQVLTLKDIDGGTATNSSRITIPKAAKATLTALTRKQATVVYASDEDKLYFDTGATLVKLTDVTTTADDIGTGMTSTGANAVAATRTRATGTTVAAGGVAISSSSGSFSSTSSTYVDVTNLSVTITSSGRPLRVSLILDSAATGGWVEANNSSGTDATSIFKFMRSVSGAGVYTSLGEFSLHGNGASGSISIAVPPGSFDTIDAVAAASYDYKFQGKVSIGTSFQVISAKLCVYEL